MFEGFLPVFSLQNLNYKSVKVKLILFLNVCFQFSNNWLTKTFGVKVRYRYGRNPADYRLNINERQYVLLA